MSDPATDPNAALPVAGWYPDPEHDGQDRWWDGANWADHRRPREGVVAVPAAPFAAPAAGPAYVPAGTVNPYGTAPTPYGPGAVAYDPGAVAYGSTPPAYPAYGAYGYAPSAPQNVPALVGFILALVGFVIGIFTYGALALAGGIVSIVGLVKASKMKKAGLPDHRYGMALTGVIVGFGSIVLTILLLVVYFSFLFSTLGAASTYGSYGY